MSSSLRIKNRLAEAEKYGLWQFGKFDEHYIKVNGECRDSYIALPLGDATGPKICMADPRSQLRQQSKPYVGETTVYNLYSNSGSSTREQMYNPYINRDPKGWNSIKKSFDRDAIPYDGTGFQLATDIGRQTYPIYQNSLPIEDETRHRLPHITHAVKPHNIMRLEDPFLYAERHLSKQDSDHTLYNTSFVYCGSKGTYVQE